MRAGKNVFGKNEWRLWETVSRHFDWHSISFKNQLLSNFSAENEKSTTSAYKNKASPIKLYPLYFSRRANVVLSQISEKFGFVFFTSYASCMLQWQLIKVERREITWEGVHGNIEKRSEKAKVLTFKMVPWQGYIRCGFLGKNHPWSKRVIQIEKWRFQAKHVCKNRYRCKVSFHWISITKQKN